MNLLATLLRWLHLPSWHGYAEAAAENVRREAEGKTSDDISEIRELNRRTASIVKQQGRRIKSNTSAIDELIRATRFGDRQ